MAVDHTALRDETTRLLSAAAHLDYHFADQAIREFLTEPRRAVAPSPGVNAAVVLREAVAARTKRRWRDLLLAVLMTVFAITNLPWFLLWLPTSLLWRWFGPRRRRIDRGLRALTGQATIVVVINLAILGAVAGLIHVVAKVIGAGSGSPDLAGALGSDPFGQASPVSGLSGNPVVAGLLALVILAVLTADRLVVWKLITTSFQRRQFTAEPSDTGWSGERHFRTMGTAGLTGLLNRVATSPSGNVVVYCGDKPFVGAGEPYYASSLAIPLEADPPKGSGGLPAVPGDSRFTVTELHDYVATQLTTLRAPASLSPSRRLGGLSVLDKIFVSADALLWHLGEPETKVVLPDASRPPLPRVSDDVLRSLTECSVEWMRYYRCFELESWDRDVAVSLYVNLGAGDQMLYLEFTFLRLLPLRQAYRNIDYLPRGSFAPVLDAFGSAVALPTTIVSRVRSAVRRTRPLTEPPRTVAPSQYGASRSLREMAAADAMDEYFRSSDVNRYVKILQAQFIRAVGRFLESKGLSATEFMRQAAATNYTTNVYDNRTHVGSVGQMINSAIGGESVANSGDGARPGQDPA